MGLIATITNMVRTITDAINSVYHMIVIAMITLLSPHDDDADDDKSSCSCSSCSEHHYIVLFLVNI